MFNLKDKNMNNNNSFKTTTTYNTDDKFWDTFTIPDEKPCDNTMFMLDDIMGELKYIHKQVDEIKEYIMQNGCCDCKCSNCNKNSEPIEHIYPTDNYNDNSKLNKYDNTDNLIKPEEKKKDDNGKATLKCSTITEFSDMLDTLFGADLTKDIDISFF